jgi:hypothetical protein
MLQRIECQRSGWCVSRSLHIFEQSAATSPRVGSEFLAPEYSCWQAEAWISCIDARKLLAPWHWPCSELRTLIELTFVGAVQSGTNLN